jgi:hypothetical protein
MNCISQIAAQRKTVYAWILASLAVISPSALQAQRITLLLDGTWSIADGVEPSALPTSFKHTVAVPGLVHSAKPPFPGVDQYETHEFIWTMKRDGVLPATEKLDELGRTTQKRNYFWYRRTFRAPARKQRAVLVVNLKTTSGGDSSTTRFGMREFHFEGERAILNGQVIYLRGASITLHRFFADPNAGGLPWDEAWVRKFLVDIPKRMQWNAFRVCIGPAPQRWLDVADEAGLLLQYEYPIWDDREPLRHKLWKEEEILTQFKEFVRDNWNHPSVALWDASNETHWGFLGDKVIPAVRGLDLSRTAPGRTATTGLRPQATPTRFTRTSS